MAFIPVPRRIVEVIKNMGLIGSLVTIGIAIFAVKAWYSRTQISAGAEEAINMLPDNPEGGYKKIEPVFGFSNATSFGMANETRDAFFNAVRDRTVTKLQRAKMDEGWFDHMVEALRVLRDAERDHGLQLEGHRAAIVTAARDAQPKLMENLSLVAWDNFVDRIDKAQDADLIPKAPFEGYDEWRASLHKEDRRGIAVHAAVQAAAGKLGDGVRALGLTPGYAPTDPAVGALSEKVKDGQLIEAEQAFGAGAEECRRFMRTFKLAEVPPELLEPLGKLTCNQAAIKTAHVQQMGTNELATNSSRYIVKILVAPGADAVPSEGQLYGAFVQGAAGQIEEAIRLLEKAASLPSAPPELPQLLAAAYRSQAILGEVTQNPQWNQAGAARLQALKGRVIPNQTVSQSVATIEIVAGVPIILK